MSSQYYLKNKDKINLHNREYYLKNKDKASLRNKLYRMDHRKELLEKKKQYYSENKVHLNFIKKLDRKNNPLKILERNRRYIRLNNDKVKKSRTNYYLNNKKIISDKNKLYYLKNRLKKIAYRKKYYIKNKEIINVKSKMSREINKEKINKHQREYRRLNHKKILERNKIYRRSRMNNDPTFRAMIRIRSSFNHIFKIYLLQKKFGSSKKYGLDYRSIIEHLKPFPEDLSNYHIDHIKPLCSFNFLNSDKTINLEEIIKAYAPTNLRWLPKEENIKKGQYDKKLSVKLKELNNGNS